MDINPSFNNPNKSLDSFFGASYDFAVKYAKGLIPPQEGFTRHQYFFQFSSPEWDSWTQLQQIEALNAVSGSPYNTMLMEEVFYNKKWTVFRLWLDIKSDSSPFQDMPEKS